MLLVLGNGRDMCIDTCRVDVSLVMSAEGLVGQDVRIYWEVCI